MKRKISTLRLFLSTGVFFLLTACAAYDLGSSGNTFYEPPDVNAPQWGEGISLIVEKKCATCHTAATPWYKPKNTPELPNSSNPNFGLNYIALEAFFDKQNSLMSLVKKCVESKCGTENIPMPPAYATPLSPNEKTALLNFVTPLIPAATINLSESFKTTCGGCHGADGRSGSFPKLGGPTGTAKTFEQFKTIIQNGQGGMPAQAGYDINQAQSDYDLLYK
jgi:mono/diheme cytochrome c family protein